MLSREKTYKQCRETFLSLLPGGVKPRNGSTSRGVLEIVAEPEFFFPTLWSNEERFHYLYDQSHRSLSLRARRYDIGATPSLLSSRASVTKQRFDSVIDSGGVQQQRTIRRGLILSTRVYI